MTKKNILSVCAIVLALVLTLASCRESDRVSYNVSKEADNFNVTRRLAVINARTDKPVFELIGRFAISNNGANELEIVVEVEKGRYKKHMVYLNEWTLYVVEDVSGASVDEYRYEVNFLPETFIPFTVTSND